MELYHKCIEVIRAAGKRLLDMQDYDIEKKGNVSNIVTTCDEQTQAFLIAELGKLEPEATFVCEENDQLDISGNHMFIIDPIDGTTNFVKGYNMSAISVAYADHEEVLWGVVYNPYTDELYSAYKGNGAYMNGRAIHVTDEPLNRSLVAFGTSPYYDDLRKKSFDLAYRIMEDSMDIRRSGSAALDMCYVASGKTGLYFECLLSPWDFAAGMCIVSEAGGTVISWEKESPDYTKKNGIVAGTVEAVELFSKKYI